jgi:hypothetical protein
MNDPGMNDSGMNGRRGWLDHRPRGMDQPTGITGRPDWTSRSELSAAQSEVSAARDGPADRDRQPAGLNQSTGTTGLPG